MNKVTDDKSNTVVAARLDGVVMPALELHLGSGDKLISDVYDDENGEWAGIAISEGECPVGEFINTGAKMIEDLNPLLVIKTANSKSLDVVIAACERAKARLEA